MKALDITQLQYFVSIVTNNFNITATAKKIHISQPALSRFVTKFENQLANELFVRKNGRLIGLTNAGEIVHARALNILSEQNAMLRQLNEITRYYQGYVRIGVPPIILSILMTQPLSKLMLINPGINFILTEDSSFDVQLKLNQKQLEFGLLMSPNEMNKAYFNEDIIYNEELVLYVNQSHELAQKSSSIHWEDLNQYQLAILNDRFMIHHLLIAKFNQHRVTPRILHQVSSWDFLLETVKSSNLVTILPKQIHRVGQVDSLVRVQVEDPVNWKIALISEHKSNYTQIETYVRESLINYFASGENLENLIAMI